MRPFILSETNWKLIKKYKYDLAILPWGATEAHNYHLPYATDNIQVEKIIEEAGKIAWNKRKKFIILPTIPFGVNTGQKDILLNINMNPSTQYKILLDIIRVLNRQGIKKLLVFNGHGGNSFNTMLREIGVDYPNMFLCSADWYKSLIKKNYFENKGDHADEMETSLILHLRPDLVSEMKNWGEGKENKIKSKLLREKWTWFERKWSKASNDTGIGNPIKSTKEKGENYFKDVTNIVSKLVIEICDLDINNQYETKNLH